MTNPFDAIEQRFDRMEELLQQFITSNTQLPQVKEVYNELITASELARHLSISKETVLKRARDGALPYYKPGKNYMFNLDEVNQTISSRTPLVRKKRGGSKS